MAGYAPFYQLLHVAYDRIPIGHHDSLTFRSFSLFKAWFSASVFCTSSFLRMMVVFLVTVRWPSLLILDSSAAGREGEEGSTAD